MTNNQISSKLIKAIILGIFILIGIRSFFYLIYTLWWPLTFSPDASILQFEAWSILQKKTPYIDFFSINLPITHFIHGLGILLFGSDDLGFRLLNFTYILIIAIINALYLKRFSKLTGFLGFIFTFTLTLDITPFGQFQREILQLPFFIGMLWISERNEQWDYKISMLFGLLFSLSFYIKPTSIFLLIFISLILIKNGINNSFGDSLKEKIKNIIGISFGFLLISLIPFLFSYPKNWMFLWLDNLSAYSQGVQLFKAILSIWNQPFSLSIEHFFNPFNYYYFNSSGLIIGVFTLYHFLLLILFTVLIKNKYRKFYYSMMILIVSGYLNFLFQKRGFSYHIIPTLFGFVLIQVSILGELYFLSFNNNLIKSNNTKLIISIFTLILTIVIAIRFINSEKVFKKSGFGSLLKPIKHSNPLTDEIILIDSIIKNKLKNQNTTIQILETHSLLIGIVMSLNMEFVTGFSVDYPLYLENEVGRKNRKFFMENMNEKKPDIIALEVINSNPDEKLMKFPELKSLISEKYSLIKEHKSANSYNIYIRNDHLPLNLF
jgi:hypothetical protein